jgi:hypothetical protein
VIHAKLEWRGIASLLAQIPEFTLYVETLDSERLTPIVYQEWAEKSKRPLPVAS